MDLEYALEEEIGNPGLFVGRREELTYFSNWLQQVKRKTGKSTALLARRRKGSVPDVAPWVWYPRHSKSDACSTLPGY